MEEERKAGEYSVSLEDLEGANPHRPAFSGIEPTEEISPEPEVSTDAETPEESEKVEVKEEVTEEVVEPVREKEDRPAIKGELSQGEKSALGRKLAAAERRLEEEQRRNSEKIARLEGMLEGLASRQGPETPAPPDVEPGEPMTQEQVEALWNYKESQRVAEEKGLQEEADRYESDYRSALFDELSEDTPHYEELMGLLSAPGSPYNQVHTLNAKEDFRINLTAARAHILEKENKKLQEELKSANPKLREEEVSGAGVGASAGVKSKEKPVTLPTDKESVEYLKYLKKTMSNKEYSEFLKRNLA